MDMNKHYTKCPECQGQLFNDQTFYHENSLEIIVYCDDCGFTWSETYDFAYNTIEETNG